MPRAQRYIASFGLMAAIVAVWTLQHPYAGLAYNDASLYSILALARLHPASLTQDVFLRFGSQDSFTIFSPLFAEAIRAWDLEPATALLAWVSQIAFFLGAWLFARQIMAPRLALLSVGLLLALPGDYAPSHLFSYVEDFLTPRQIAEALVLAALAAFLARRPLIAGICIVTGGLLHPIMALIGPVMMLCMRAVEKPRVWLPAGVLLVLAPMPAVVFISTGPFTRVDATWLKILTDSASYLLISRWAPEDWGHIAVAAAVLAVGSLTTRAAGVRNLCRAALLLAATGILVTLIYCDYLRVLIFLQAQPWRCLWLVDALAVVLLPIVIIDCGKAGSVGRATALMLLSAWIVREHSAALGISALSVLCAAMVGHLEAARSGRLILPASCAVLLLSLAINVGPKLLYVPVSATAWDPVRLWLPDPVSIWLTDGVLYGALLACAYWLAERSGSWPALPGLLGLCAAACASAIACVALLPFAWQSWTAFEYTGQLHAQLDSWRKVIPEHAETIWPGSPVGAWYLLERPSYYSFHQIAGDIFSRPKAMEMRRRTQLIMAALHSADTKAQPDLPGGRVEIPVNADNLSARGLATACEDPALSFVVTRTSLGPTPFEPIRPHGARAGSQLHLYRCADVLSVQSPSHSAALRH